MRPFACLFLSVGIALTASAEGAERRPGAPKTPLKVRAMPAPDRPAADAPEPHWWIQYDTGVNAGFPAGAMHKTVGNRFNTASGMTLVGNNAMLESVTLFPEVSGTQSFSVFATPNAAGTAMLIDYFAAPLKAGQFNVVQLDPPLFNLPPDFIVAFMGVFGAGGRLVGLDSHSLPGVGFHAVEGRYSMGAMHAITPIPGRNAMVRVRGFFVTPVELIDFRIQ
ncbi:MAG: hypothetical protein ABW221_14150 [Vicinamibacteria bacterium]